MLEYSQLLICYQFVNKSELNKDIEVAAWLI